MDIQLSEIGTLINLSRDILFVVLYVGAISSNRPNHTIRKIIAFVLLVLLSVSTSVMDHYFYDVIFDSAHAKQGHAMISIYRNLVNTFAYFIYIYILKNLSFKVILYDTLLVSSICMACHNFALTPITKPILDVNVMLISDPFMNWLICMLLLNVFSLAIYYIIAKSISLDNIRFVENYPFLLATILFLISFYFNFSVKSIEFIDFQYRPQLSTYIIILQFLFLMCIAYFQHYQHSVQKQSYIALENQAVISLLRNIRSQEKSNTRLRHMRHDFRNHLISLRHLVDNHENEKAIEYIDHLSHEYLSYRSNVQTGNLIVDGILSHKMDIAMEHNVTISAAVDFSYLDSMANTDLCIIFGNLLDNALEACMKTDDGPRFITMRGQEMGETIIYSIENSFNGDVYFVNNVPVTTKAKKTIHGMGLISVQDTVAKYSGTIAFSSKNNLFSVVCAFPLPLSAGSSKES